MGIYENYTNYIYGLGTYYADIDEIQINKYKEIMESDFSILRVWVSLFGEDMLIKPRPYNIFYSNCALHYAKDIPVCINENLKCYQCFGCGKGGTIVDLVWEYFQRSIDYGDVIDIIYACIKEETASLSKEYGAVVRRIKRHYYSEVINNYFELSKIKTDALNNRIRNYIAQNGNSEEVRQKLCRRLCCAKSHVKKAMDGKNISSN